MSTGCATCRTGSRCEGGNRGQLASDLEVARLVQAALEQFEPVPHSELRGNVLAVFEQEADAFSLLRQGAVVAEGETNVGLELEVRAGD